jgi:hypothetical protein
MKQTEDDKRICARMKEIRELIKEFGLTLYGFDPGISAYVDARPELRSSAWNGPFKLDDVEWAWLEPLLKELSARRKSGPTLIPEQKDALLNTLAYSWVRGWYAGCDGVTNDEGKRVAAKEEMEKLLKTWAESEKLKK